MKNFALIFAGGAGTRMNSKAIPKQFLELQGRPIIIHTLEHFEKHPGIDAICIVCIESWIKELNKQLLFHNITKAKAVVPGGANSQESIFNGLNALHKLSASDEDIVLIHDGVRPLINEKVITDNIECARKHGNAITVAPAIETIISIDDSGNVSSISDRKNCRLARAPQTFFLKDILEAHIKARAEGNIDAIDSACLMAHYGTPLHTVSGPMENIKITTSLDFHLFRAILQARENEQLMGVL